jgi:hypothetical protein
VQLEHLQKQHRLSFQNERELTIAESWRQEYGRQENVRLIEPFDFPVLDFPVLQTPASFDYELIALEIA